MWIIQHGNPECPQTSSYLGMSVLKTAPLKNCFPISSFLGCPVLPYRISQEATPETNRKEGERRKQPAKTLSSATKNGGELWAPEEGLLCGGDGGRGGRARRGACSFFLMAERAEEWHRRALRGVHTGRIWLKL